MYYYEVAVLSTPSIFTYKSLYKLSLYSFIKIEVKSKIKSGFIVKEVSKPKFFCKSILLDITTPFLQKNISNNITKFYVNKFLKKEYFEIASFISSYYFSSLSESITLFNPFKDNYKLSKLNIKTDIILSPAQNDAFEFIKSYDVSTIFGDTGSGKTEIYIKLIEKIINENKTAILLLPEISITSQIEKRLVKIFGNLVGIWHSKMTKKSKEKVKERIYNGEVRVVVGARSALFLPMKNLGLIIVDEAHDDSYKSSSMPRYNAKDLGIYFAKKLKIKTLLGSATPLVSDLYKFPYFRLKGTYFNTKNSVNFENSFNENIFFKIEKVLSEHKQIIVVIPTRGSFKYMICSECGEVVKCPYCDVAVSVHYDERRVKCHYCNFVSSIPSKCHKCGCEIFNNSRIGTTEVVEILKDRFPDSKIEKFDKDSITTKKKLDNRLKEFNNKEIDILVGTQMLSKGHDYHGVYLAIILDIDFVLAIADFRARERALALVKQVSGRSARKEDGETIIVTNNKDFFQQSYEEFAKEELEFRKDLRYPPFSKLAVLEFSDKYPQKAQNQMNEVLNCLKQKNLDIVGFGEAPIKRVSNKFRYQILIKGEKFHSPLYECKSKFTKVNIDPVSMF